MTTTAPSWIKIDPSSGILNVTAPEVTSDTIYDFYITSTMSEVSSSIQKHIKLIILNCVPSNCQNCIATNNTIWEVCNSGYYLVSGECQAISQTAKALSITVSSLVIVTSGVVVITSLINTASIANLWMTINQLQLFFI